VISILLINPCTLEEITEDGYSLSHYHYDYDNIIVFKKLKSKTLKCSKCNGSLNPHKFYVYLVKHNSYEVIEVMHINCAMNRTDIVGKLVNQVMNDPTDIDLVNRIIATNL